MAESSALLLHNGAAVPAADVPALPVDEFRRLVIEGVRAGAEIASLCARPEPGRSRARAGFTLLAVLADHEQGVLRVFSTRVSDSWPSLTPDCLPAHLFEREIAEQWGLRPVGHPWLKPVRFQQPTDGAVQRETPASAPLSAPPCGEMEFFRVEGEEVHEVAVGPVHAGVIEPGHFRFQCHGETVLHLEISLGFQHRGIESAFAGGPDNRTVHLAETLAGDTTIGHVLAYCETLEALAGCKVPPRALAIRAVALELERLANHVGDLGAISADVGFLPTSSWCGRVRGDLLNMSALLCGSRFGRGLVRPGGVGFDLDDRMAGDLADRIRSAAREAAGACELLWTTPSVLARLEGTGPLSAEDARGAGLTGPAARACGIDRDTRRDLPSGIWRFSHVPVATWKTGDVFARAYVRWLETQRSFAFIEEQLGSLPAGNIRAPVGAPAAGALAVSLVEGWRGCICHAALTDKAGKFAQYKVVDPSFRNWFGVALALRGQAISDFPLCNKSFNLSYCGHDL